jgi:superfamily I DNA/RNA helicase
MTRARERLVLTRARRRMWLGQVRDCAPSPFLSEIAGELVERTRAGAPRRRPPRRQLDLF